VKRRYNPNWRLRERALEAQHKRQGTIGGKLTLDGLMKLARPVGLPTKPEKQPT
jgi:hypothetical protein